jgi:AcrR family transcriptional regulator
MDERIETPETPRWQRRPTERRREILDAAAFVFGERGFESATLADVGERAGVSPGTVQHYFGTKATLFQEVLSDRFFSGAAEEKRCHQSPGQLRGAVAPADRADVDPAEPARNADPLLVGMASAPSCPEAGQVVSEMGTAAPVSRESSKPASGR